jgi:hypothetical protein
VRRCADARLSLTVAHSEHGALRLRPLDPAHHRATNAFAGVAPKKSIDTASFNRPCIPDGVIAHRSAPQFASSQVVISA